MSFSHIRSRLTGSSLMLFKKEIIFSIMNKAVEELPEEISRFSNKLVKRLLEKDPKKRLLIGEVLKIPKISEIVS